MNIYIASSFRYIADVEMMADWLQAKGHAIACEWWKTDYKKALKLEGDNWFSAPIIKVIFLRSLQAIRDCDLLILVTPEETKFNGANIEVGMALALNKPVIAYGLLEKSGMYEPVVRVRTLDDLELTMREFEI